MSGHATFDMLPPPEPDAKNVVIVLDGYHEVGPHSIDLRKLLTSYKEVYTYDKDGAHSLINPVHCGSVQELRTLLARYKDVMCVVVNGEDFQYAPGTPLADEENSVMTLIRAIRGRELSLDHANVPILYYATDKAPASDTLSEQKDVFRFYTRAQMKWEGFKDKLDELYENSLSPGPKVDDTTREPGKENLKQ